MTYIYRHIRLDKNEVFYIGIGVGYRANQKCKRNIYWERIVSKTRYIIEIMIDGLSWEDACKKEIEFIKLYGRKDKNEGTLCNLTDGGEGMLGWKCPDSVKKKLSIKNKGKLCPNVGYRHNDAVKKIMSEKGKGQKKSLGRVLSEETKEKIRQKAKAQMDRQGKKKPVFYCDKNYKIIAEYPSIKEAAISTNNHHQTIMGSCSRKLHTKSFWIYKSDYNTLPEHQKIKA